MAVNALVVGPDHDGRSVAILDGRVVGTAPEGAERLECADGVIAPGAVNAHTHLYSGLAPLGMPAPVPAPSDFLQILERVWWRLDRALDEESLIAAAEYHVARGLLAGTTSFIDHHESPNLIRGSLAILERAVTGLGARAVLCYGATERNRGSNEAREGLEECARARGSALIRAMVGLHASFTVSDETIRRAGELARELGTALHVHVAEDRADVLDARTRGWEDPLTRLEALDALVPGSIFAHGVHLTGERVRRAEAGGCWFVHNPRSNEGNRVGYAATLGVSAHVALGTDGWDADMVVENAARERLAKAHGDPMSAGRLAAGQRLIAERFGATPAPFLPGALGDLTVRDRDKRVTHAVVDGRVVVRDGRLVGGDIDEIEARARAAGRRLWSRMADI